MFRLKPLLVNIIMTLTIALCVVFFVIAEMQQLIIPVVAVGIGVMVIYHVLFKREMKNLKALEQISGLEAHNSVNAHIQAILKREQEAEKSIESLKNGSGISAFSLLSANTGIGKSLLTLQEQLRRYKEEETKLNWKQGGLAKFSELMKQGNSLTEFANIMISNIVKYVNANQGGFFVSETNASGIRSLKLVGCYAYEKRKYVEKNIVEGSGLLGECMLSQDVIYLKDVPADYADITSGLGHATPRNVIILPMVFNNQFCGAMELASFTVLAEHEVEFLKRLGENIAAEITSRKTVENTERLLQESNRLANELQAHEEEMRQHMEELTATQEEMERKQAELNSVLSAINNTVASIEFDLQGKVISANSIFLAVSGFHENDAHVLTYQRLLPEQEREKQQHEMMWSNLRQGKFFNGEFRFLGKTQEEMFLSGTFNPIFNNKGQPYKVIMIAQFTTQEKLKHQELTTALNAAKNSVAYLELDPSFLCRSANEKFLKMFGVKRLQLKNLEFTSFLNKSTRLSEIREGLKDASGSYIECDLSYHIGGQEIVLRTSFNPVKDLNDRLSKIIVIISGQAVEKRLAVEA